jgi:predicted GTPase
VSPNDIQIYQQTMCKMKNAIRSGFVPGSKPQDIIDAESLGSSSQSTATHRKIEIRASSLKENERFKSIKLYVPVLCTVGHIKEAIEQFFHISKVKLSLKNHKSEWLRDEKLLKHLNARDFIYDID